MDGLYEDLKDKINKIEYTEIKEIKEDITQIKLELNTNNLLTKQSIDSNEKLSATMDTFKDTMIEMAQSIKDSNKISSELTETVKNLNAKVDGVETKMDTKFKEFDTKIETIDEKSKIDFITWTKQNWIKILIVLLGSGYLVSKSFGISIF